MKEFPAIGFIIQIRTASCLSQLHNILKEKHGKMNDITLYDIQGTKLEDARKDETLKSIFGKIGAEVKDKAETIKVFYDFVPCNIHDPILLT